jgi:hypothetical protein
MELGSRGLNFAVLHVEFSEIKILRRTKLTRKIKNKK